MKSTVKVDYSVSAGKFIPLIKIIRPSEVLKISETDDVDPRDKQLNDFLKSPGNVFRNHFFELGTYGRLDETKPEVCTIEPITSDRLFFKFRYAILGRLVPYDTILAINNMDEDNKLQLRETVFGKSDGKISKEPLPSAGLYFKINDFFDYIDGCQWKEMEGDLI